tara:strand:+ start:39496 stop:39861 length:366 start_codon:yes stop_codon:yes gene_type:complete
MATQPVKYVFKATKYFSTTTHYSLHKATGKLLISDKLNISESRNFAKSKPVFWCQERKDNKWEKPNLTGLFETTKEEVFWGCRGKFEHLIIFAFYNNTQDLHVYYYENFFTKNLKPLITNL